MQIIRNLIVVAKSVIVIKCTKLAHILLSIPSTFELNMLGFRISGHQIDFSSENSVSVNEPIESGTS